jgi:hypothetical protein
MLTMSIQTKKEIHERNGTHKKRQGGRKSNKTITKRNKKGKAGGRKRERGTKGRCIDIYFRVMDQ